jgi:hypothetical protein
VLARYFVLVVFEVAFFAEIGLLSQTIVRRDDVVAALADHFFEFLLVGVSECELNDIVGKSLHFAVDSKPLAVDFLVFLGFLEVDGVETVRNGVIFTESLLGRYNWEGLLGANFHHQQFMLHLF